MATLGSNNDTLVDIAKRRDPDGPLQHIAETIAQVNAIIDDMPWIEGNLKTGHKGKVRTSYAAPTWRELYGFVQPTKNTFSLVTDTCGSQENYAEVDAGEADLTEDINAYRMQEDKGYVKGMSQDMAKQLFYANVNLNPERFMGLSQRYNTLSASAYNADSILNGGGVGADNASIWLIGWGKETVHGIYPRGTEAGLTHEDLGKETATDGSGGLNRVYRTHYKWRAGLHLRDHNYVVRICNIDVSDLTADATSGANLVELMTDALEVLPTLDGVTPVFYMNKKLRTMLRHQMRNHKNVNLEFSTVMGKRVLHFDEVPVKRCDALLNTESAVA